MQQQLTAHFRKSSNNEDLFYHFPPFFAMFKAFHSGLSITSFQSSLLVFPSNFTLLSALQFGQIQLPEHLISFWLVV
jgi:hypothetical protein